MSSTAKEVAEGGKKPNKRENRAIGITQYEQLR